MRIILIANGFHFLHVGFTDVLVATLVEDDAWIIPVINDGIAHYGLALLPSCAVHVCFRIAGGHGLHETYAVAAFNVLLPWSDVHPADEVAIAFDHEAIAVIAEPGGNGKANRRPFV